LGIGVLIPIFSFITGTPAFGTDVISRNIGAAFAYLNIQPRLAPLIILICSLFIAQAILKLIFGYVISRMVANFENEKRKAIYQNALYASWPYLLQQKIGHLQHMLVNHLAFVFSSLRSIAHGVTNVTGLIVYVVIALSISPITTILTLAGGVVFLMISNPLTAKIKKYAEKRTEMAHGLARYIAENSLGLKTIKAMAIEEYVIKFANKLFDRFTIARKMISFTKAISSVMLQPFSIIFISAVFAVSYKLPNFDLGVFVATIYLIHRTFIYVGKAQEVLNEMHDTIPYVKSIDELETELRNNKEAIGGAEPFEFKDNLAFKNVAFAYSPEIKVFESLNFSIKRGEMIGVVGPSGVGKTTLVDLLLRLFSIGGGEILLDGKNINQINIKEWRRNIGYVSQDIFLKNTTIEHNIKFYDDSITDEKMIEAAKMVGIYDFIMSLPAGFQSIVGERGVLLSGGQRQRVVLARVLARNPNILVLDEATSALDNESEAVVKATIEKFKGSITIIAIAHRLSTIMGSDRLLVLGNGGLVEEGSPAELLARKDSYFYKVNNVI
jgi:ABC-type multidrug transport system fused ATPase/permease subunit